MLHTNKTHCGLGQYIRQLKLKHSNSSTYVHNSLYGMILLYAYSYCMPEFRASFSNEIGRENICYS